ncbi:hypothetical protein MASR1M45_20260 [Candidatus Kapaibacterium sp.]
MNFYDRHDSFFDDDNFDNMDEKIRYYQKILRSKNRSRLELPDENVIESIVDYCISVERYRDGLEFCNIWLVNNPESADAYLKSAVIYSQLNRSSDALKHINKALDIEPSMLEALLTKALILEQTGELNHGLAIIDKILAYEPGNEDVLFRKAMLLQSAFKTEEALDILIYLENVDYQPEEVYQEIAHCYHMLYEFNKSTEYYQKSLDINPFDYLIWYNMGVMYGHKGANYKSIDCYKMSLALKKDFTPALFNLGNAYSATSRLVEAISTYLELLTFAPGDIETMNNLAGTFADNKQYLSAIEYYTKVLNIDNTYHPAYFGRGFCYDALDNFEKALRDYDTALVFTPESKNILQQKADLLYNFGNVHSALECYIRALEIDPNDEHSIFDVAFIYYELGDYDNAEMFAERLIDLSYSYADAWYLLGKIYARRDNTRKSAKCLSEAISLDSSKFEDFENEFPALTNNYSKLNKIVQKNLKSGKGFFGRF